MLMEKGLSVNMENNESSNILQDGRRKHWFWDYNDVFSSNLSKYAKLVRLYLAKCANGDRQAWPSYNDIAKTCDISRDTAKRAIEELLQKGWIKKINRFKENGLNLSNIYTLCDPPAPEQEQSGPRGVGAHSTGVGAVAASNNTHRLPCRWLRKPEKVQRGTLRPGTEQLTRERHG